FYAEQLKFLKPVTIEQSVTYSFIQPWGPAVINALGSILPFFKNMFDELGHFFEGVADRL
ncbi:MAG TPA: CvpA family protein, partial [Chitinophagaceae bacterium]|nr:CvpA family protein [Chitinophagaceae bacterium]